MQVLEKYCSNETNVKGSRFLSELIPCSTQAEARDILRAQKEKYADATHVVHAFITGLKGEVMGMSDDGEPSGTAGRPVLDVVKGSGATNFICTVTRWFGGTLLGTGGLVKAYSEGAKFVIEKARTENDFVEYIEKTDFIFEIDYSSHKLVKNRMEPFTLFDVTEDFGSGVTISGKIKSTELEDFSKMLKNLSNGKIIL